MKAALPKEQIKENQTKIQQLYRHIWELGPQALHAINQECYELPMAMTWGLMQDPIRYLKKNDRRIRMKNALKKKSPLIKQQAGNS